MPSSPNLSLLDLSENPFAIASTRGKFFTYNNNLYIVYVEQDKKIRIKTGLTTTDIYDGTSGSDTFVIYDVYLDSTTLYIAGKYGSQGFYISYNMSTPLISGLKTDVSSVDLISHIFVINSKIHFLHRTETNIGLSVISGNLTSTVYLLDNLTPQKNAYVRDYLYSGGTLFFFVQQEDDSTNYLNLRVYYHYNYDTTSSFEPFTILLKTDSKHTLFSSISQMNGVNYLLTIKDDYIEIDSSENLIFQTNRLYLYNLNNFFEEYPPPYFGYIDLSGVSIISLKNISYQGYNHLFGFGYQGSYENAKYLIVPLENNFSSNPQFTTKSSSMGYISTNSSVEVLSFQNKVYVYLETRPVETSPSAPQTQIIGTTRAMISDFSYREIGNTIVNGFISPLEILNLESGSTFNFIDPVLPVDLSCAIFYDSGFLSLGSLNASGPQVSIENASPNMKFIFGSISDQQMTDFGITDDFAMVLKVVDSSSGQVLENLSPPLMINIYLDTSGGSIVRLRINDTGSYNAGTGTLVGFDQATNKWKYTSTLTKGNGYSSGKLSTPSPSAGSDPHITTIFGTKYDFYPSTRKNYTLFQSKDIKIDSHFTGFKSGVFYDKVMIGLKGIKEKIDIDFNKKKIKGGKCNMFEIQQMDSKALGVKYHNTTSDKSVGDFFDPKKLTKIEYKGKNPMDLFVDFQTRYVHFRFPGTLPPVNEMSGLIVKEASRLD